MPPISYKIQIHGTFEDVINQVTQALQGEGFGILTRIDLHSKVKEKLGKDLRPVAILGACNPQLAYDAYSQNPDVASLLPCNAVVREIASGTISVEIAKPTVLLQILNDSKLNAMAEDADRRLQRVASEMQSKAA